MASIESHSRCSAMLNRRPSADRCYRCCQRSASTIGAASADVSSSTRNGSFQAAWAVAPFGKRYQLIHGPLVIGMGPEFRCFNLWLEPYPDATLAEVPNSV